MYKCYLTCPRGLEEITQHDIRPIIPNSVIHPGGVEFQTDLAGIYNTNIHSRTGMHLLIELFEFEAYDIESIYKQVYNFDWSDIIDNNQTFMVKVRGKSSCFKNNQYTTLKIKDAIVDQIKIKKLSRPSVDKNNPHIIISIFISENHIKVYLDSSGVPLHKRGYRNKIHRAALNEALAAGLILLSNWNKTDPFYDLMCGSGTIPIEAALIAHNIAPGLFRKNFSFQNWNNYDSDLFNKITHKTKEDIKIKSHVKIYGSDISFSNIAMCLSSIKSLDLSNLVQFIKQDIINFKSSEPIGVIIINPPYGERLKPGEENLSQLYQTIGDVFKKQNFNFDAYIFSSNLEMIKNIGLKSEKKYILKNGRLDCRFVYYPISSSQNK